MPYLQCMNLTVLLFEDFETLDVFGPVEIFGRLTDLYKIRFASLEGRLTGNRHGVNIPTERLEALKNRTEIFLIPGGYGTRKEVYNQALIDAIQSVSEQSKYVMTVCTGTALLARTGLLDGLPATSNKKAFSWVMENGPNVQWNKTARWVSAGKFYTSSGVTAGMDMSLGFLEEQHGLELATRVANDIEYAWIRDKDHDSFVAMIV